MGYEDFANAPSAYERFTGNRNNSDDRLAFISGAYEEPVSSKGAAKEDPTEVMRRIRVRNELAAAMREAQGPQPQGSGQIGWGSDMKDIDMSKYGSHKKVAQLNGKDLDFRKYQIAVDEDLSVRKAGEKLSVADQYRQVAKRMLTVDPNTSNEYFKKALDLEKQGREIEEKNLKIAADKANLLGTYAGDIQDQNTLTESVSKMEGLGVKVPDRFKVYTPESMAYWKNKALDSSTYREKLRMQEAEATSARKAAQDKKQYALDERKVKVQEAAEERLREGGKAPKPTDTDKFDVGTTTEFLKEINPKFDDLPQAEQIEASKYVKIFTQKFMKTNGGDESLARAKAIEEVQKYVGDTFDFSGIAKAVGNKAEPKEAYAPDVQAAFEQLKHTPAPGYRYWIDNGRLKREKQ